MSRYTQMFDRLRREGAGAFVPFTVVGDPDIDSSYRIIRCLAKAGADALELGLPFSDPVADGPTIQAADLRALGSGVRADDVWRTIAAVRAEWPTLPIGLLVYANLVEVATAAVFYQRAATAGVDSVLIADVPTVECELYARAAADAGILPVLIAAASSSDEHLRTIATTSKGYVYVVTRAGVTGAETEARLEETSRLLQRLAALQAAEPLLGFGISRPEHVRAALRAGAAGVIAGSAVVQQIADHLDRPQQMLDAVSRFVSELKQATKSS
ncbi:MAG: tryptophan synthase subunit alpha [Myxococcales bacterium]|nr:tryptophan synthase subunit alpha [Myxococcales bacterium]